MSAQMRAVCVRLRQRSAGALIQQQRISFFLNRNEKQRHVLSALTADGQFEPPFSPTLDAMGLRAFSSRGGGGGGNGGGGNGGGSRRRKAKETEPLSNETLVRKIMNSRPQDSVETIQVRMVVGRKEPRSEVVSLAEALDLSVDREMDLVEVNLRDNPPVIRVARLRSIMAQKERAAAKNRPKVPKKKKFRFRTGIEAHDMDRKISDMRKCLEKKVPCEINILVKRGTTTADGLELAGNVQSDLADVGTFRKQPSVNEQGNYINAIMDPGLSK